MLDLALQLLEEALVVSRPDYQLSTTLPPAEARQFITERECIRRCFWLVQTMCWINGIYTYRPMRPRSVDLMRIVRLPVDEMSFELAKTPEPGEWVSFLMPIGIMMLTPLFLLFRDRAVPVMSLFPFPPPLICCALSDSPCVEFLHVPAPRTKTASQFGHVCRMLSMYQQLQTILGKGSLINPAARPQ